MKEKAGQPEEKPAVGMCFLVGCRETDLGNARCRKHQETLPVEERMGPDWPREWCWVHKPIPEYWVTKYGLAPGRKAGPSGLCEACERMHAGNVRRGTPEQSTKP